jgi:hypothetical protein
MIVGDEQALAILCYAQRSINTYKPTVHELRAWDILQHAKQYLLDSCLGAGTGEKVSYIKQGDTYA